MHQDRMQEIRDGLAIQSVSVSVIHVDICGLTIGIDTVSKYEVMGTKASVLAQTPQIFCVKHTLTDSPITMSVIDFPLLLVRPNLL